MKEDPLLEIGMIDMAPIPASEFVNHLPEKSQIKFGMRWRGDKVDCKVVDVGGFPFCPPERLHNLVPSRNSEILKDQISIHQRDGWVVASIQRLDCATSSGTPLDFPSYRIIFVRREI